MHNIMVMSISVSQYFGIFDNGSETRFYHIPLSSLSYN